MSHNRKARWSQFGVVDLLLLTLVVAVSIVIVQYGGLLGIFLPAVIGVALPYRLGRPPVAIGLSVLLAYAIGGAAIVQAPIYFHEIYPVPITQLNDDAWIDTEIKICSAIGLVFATFGSILACILASVADRLRLSPK